MALAQLAGAYTSGTQVLCRVLATLGGLVNAPFPSLLPLGLARCRDLVVAAPSAAPVSSGPSATSKTRRRRAKTAQRATRRRRSRPQEAVVTLPPSVRIAGVRVGRLVPSQAEKVVQKRSTSR